MTNLLEAFPVGTWTLAQKSAILAVMEEQLVLARHQEGSETIGLFVVRNPGEPVG